MKRGKNLWQSRQWQQLQNWAGHECIWLDGVLVLIKTLPRNKTYFEIQRCERLSAAFWRQLNDLTQQRDAIFAKFAPITATLNTPQLTAQIRHGDSFPAQTLVVDLQLTKTELLAQMRTAGRRHIKAAAKAEVSVVESLDLKKFAVLIKATGQRQGFGVHSAAYFNQLLEVFGDAARLLVAKTVTGEWAAAGVFVFYGGVATYYYGASDPQHGRTQGATALQWQAMQLGQQLGCKSYDFLGIAPPDSPQHRLAGVTRFKQKFGGRLVSYHPTVIVVFQPWWYRAYRVVRWLRRR